MVPALKSCITTLFFLNCVCLVLDPVVSSARSQKNCEVRRSLVCFWHYLPMDHTFFYLFIFKNLNQQIDLRCGFGAGISY